MIKIEKVEKSYMCCTACQSKENLFSIIIGFNERQTSTVRLCKKCLTEMNNKIRIAEGE